MKRYKTSQELFEEKQNKPKTNMDLFLTICLSVIALFALTLWKFATSDADLTLLFTSKFGRSTGKKKFSVADPDSSEVVYWLHELELELRLSYYGTVSYAPS